MIVIGSTGFISFSWIQFVSVALFKGEVFKTTSWTNFALRLIQL